MATIQQKITQAFQAINPFGTRANIDPKKNLAGMIAPVQLQRIRQDVMSWREAIGEAENAWYPHRVKMQRLYVDTVLNGHVGACIERRKDLTQLRKFELTTPDGKVSEDAMLVFCDVVMKGGDKTLTPKKWLSDFISYGLDSIFYGYTLISLGDVEEDSFKKITPIKRWNVSPDRMNVTNFTYSIGGTPFQDEPYRPWHIYADTPNDIGTSPCGFGLLYKVGIYEIFLRNLLGFNGDFLEMYAQPYRVGKTMKTTEAERAELEKALRDMGSAGYAIIDPTDEIEFLETALGGTGYKGYDNLEARCEKKISKLILGHADALDSTPGKLGSNNGDDNPVHEALEDKQTKDGAYIENLINKELIPRMVELGFNIDPETKFSFKNDAEAAEIRMKEDESNLKTATLFKTIKDAGGSPDWEYFSKRTGIKTEKEAVKEPVEKPFKPAFSESVKNKLENLYK